MQEIEGYDEPDPDSDYDYEDTYAKKRKRRSTKSARNSTADSPMRRGVKVSSSHPPYFTGFKIVILKKSKSINISFIISYLLYFFFSNVSAYLLEINQ